MGGAATADGKGYWLATERGGIYNYGDAVNYGSAIHERRARPFIAVTPTPDGGGYWLLDSKGAIYSYGDAGACGSARGIRTGKPIVAMAATPDGGGYWLVTASGAIYNYGDAGFYGSAVHIRLRGSVVAICSSVDGKGYWLATSKGAIYNFGDAAFFGSEIHTRLRHPITSMASTIDGNGYWLASSKGSVYNFGDATFSGSLAAHQPRGKITIVAFARSVASQSSTLIPLPHATFGYDISNYQCSKKGSSVISNNLPPTSSISVLEVVGWLDSAQNSCLAAQANWANAAAGSAGAAYNLYIFMNSPDQGGAAAALDGQGPQGNCSTVAAAARQTCLAYNYGYNGALAAYHFASGAGVRAQVWWVDVENSSLSPDQYSHAAAGQYWSSSIIANDLVIQGAINALRGNGLTVGIYSTSVQYPKIAGNFVPSGAQVPLWIAGVPWTNPPYSQKGLLAPAALASWCNGTAKYGGTNTVDVFAGGVPWLLQETPGTISSPYGLDPDYSC